MPNVPLPSDRHSAATFTPGRRVYDQVTRQRGTVGPTTFKQNLSAPPVASSPSKLPSLFQVPEATALQLVTVTLDDGSTVVRLSTQLHGVGSAADAGRVDLNRVKSNGAA